MKKFFLFILFSFLTMSVLTACEVKDNSNDGSIPSKDYQEPTESLDEPTGSLVDDKNTDIPSDLVDNVNTLAISFVSGTNDAYSYDEKILTFAALTADTVYSLTGEFNGSVVIDAQDYKFELELAGVTIYSSATNPITILSGDKVTISSKKNTVNHLYDLREEVTDSTAYKAAIYAKADLALEGKGELLVISANNNGIHTKDDLKIKNLTLGVTCMDNALKGNDSVTISSGSLTLIAKNGDGIKTTNTDISSKGNQRGTVSISGGEVNIYASCDGIDAAYTITISDDAILNIYTDRYSPYSSETESTLAKRYIRFTNANYYYAVKYYNSDTDYKWVNAKLYKTVEDFRTKYYYYNFDSLEGYNKVMVYIYDNEASLASDDYIYKTDLLSWNTAFDTIAFEYRRNNFSYNWVNYTTTMRPGPGGGMDGNTEKGDHSTKGLKANNEVIISGGKITIKAYDDAIHANGDETLENNQTSIGNVTISGGEFALFSKDDAIHADGTATISGGIINISNCYEGVEGAYVSISGGTLSITSTDDGINATTTSGTGISFLGGDIYIYAGGDGIDSNSRTAYQGILFAGGKIVVISTSGGDSSIDTENGYTYTGGSVVAICPANGMGQEATNCQNFNAIATKTNLSLALGDILKITSGDDNITVTMPCRLQALVIYLGSSNAKITN